MSIQYLLEDIKDYEREVRSLKFDIEYYQAQVKLFKHKAKTEREDKFYKRAMTELANEYTEKCVGFRSTLVTAERNLRVAKLRLKRYFEEES